ncbi:MAG: PIN domain-containing protein [Candidatus Omnitrophica bacterium]|nr:PIN domain-containing protein [Candidatus Omnitrophota bacterium]
MQLIVDGNILIAAFLKSALTREILFDERVKFFAPEYFAIEVAQTFKKSKSLKNRIKLNKEQIQELINFLLEPIEIIPEEEYASFMDKAKKEVPFDDAPYLALSLALKIPIWHNDTTFKKQSLVKVYTTAELIKLLKS